MKKNLEYWEARDLLLDYATPVPTERLPLSECAGRILADIIIAVHSVPEFDRSAYDGYAIRSGDISTAEQQQPITLKILKEVLVGEPPCCCLTPGTAAKIFTGAPIPDGADAVEKYELTHFSDREVTLFAPLKQGANIVRAGEDIQAGATVAQAGTLINAALAGILAAQQMDRVLVYSSPRVGIISTGNELMETDGPLSPGKIRDSNRYMLGAVLKQAGCIPDYLGLATDAVSSIAGLITKGLSRCDMVVLTGGVSVGDHDLTPAAMEHVGARILFQRVNLKPGMACTYGVKDGKMICGLSGNPASAITNFYAVAMPALKRLAGEQDVIPKEICLRLDKSFLKKSPKTRLLYGTLDLSDGTARFRYSQNQGNAVLSSMLGCNAMAVIPGGSGPIDAGSMLKGFLL
ncbi:MAG: gephyrin-like molybdotransferase Glp [Lawsonibacter sp.]|nr:gephyrin-like molybdotransferase Glp [Lawsonibacter sp.]